MHGGEQMQGLDYFEPYSPVATWVVIKFIMIICTILKWNCGQAFPQANVGHDMYMNLPAEIKPTNYDKNHVLLLKKNLYGQKQAKRVFYLYLKQRLTNIGFWN